MIALGSSPLDLGHFFTDVNVKLSPRRKKNRFYKCSNSTSTWLHREVSGDDENFVVLPFLLSLEEAGAEGLGTQRGSVCAPLVAHVMPGTDRSHLPGTCLGSEGLAALGDTAGPHRKGVEPA